MRSALCGKIGPTDTLSLMQRGETLLAVLAGCSVYSKLTQMLILAETAFFMRMSQRLSEFEVRRVEADIRTVTPNLIHRITARFKSLLHECHQVRRELSEARRSKRRWEGRLARNKQQAK